MEKKLTLELIEKDGEESNMVEITLLIIKEYFGCIYDMWKSIGEGCQSIPLYLYQQGFTNKEFMYALDIANELHLYACEQRKQDMEFIYDAFKIHRCGFTGIMIDHLTNMEVINITRLFEIYSGYVPILDCMKSKIVSIYDKRSVFDVMYHATPFMYDTKGNRAWLREMSGNLKNNILLPYVPELRFISTELTGIDTKEVQNILEHYLCRRVCLHGRLVSGYNIKPVFYSGCDKSSLIVHQYIDNDFHVIVKQTAFNHYTSLIGINNDITTSCYYYLCDEIYDVNICTNNKDNIFNGGERKINTGENTRHIRISESNQIIAAVSNEEYVAYLTTEEESDNLHIIPVNFPKNCTIPITRPKISNKAILIAPSPRFLYYVDYTHCLYRIIFDLPFEEEEKLGKHVVQISSGISILICLKKDSLLQFCQHQDTNLTINIPYEGRMISFIATNVGCLFHTTTGIYIAVIEGIEIRKIVRMPFSNLSNTPPSPYVSNFMPIIHKKMKRVTDEDVGEPSKRIKLG